VAYIYSHTPPIGIQSKALQYLASTLPTCKIWL
jgi:hypothetical protein